MGIDSESLDLPHSIRIPEAAVGTDRLGQRSQILLHPFHHGLELCVVGGLPDHIRGHDHLGMFIDGGLRVEALHESCKEGDNSNP